MVTDQSPGTKFRTMVANSSLVTTLLLCRHAESQWNAAGLVQGQAVEAGGLTKKGLWQAQRLGQRLRRQGIDALYSSDLLRAVETANVVGQLTGHVACLDGRWREIALGRWQGLMGSEIEERWPEEWAAARRGEDVARGGGETFAQVQDRTMAAVADLVARHPGQRVAIICHGGNVRVCLAAAQGYPPGQVYIRQNRIPNTSVTALLASQDQLQTLLVTDIEHLD